MTYLLGIDIGTSAVKAALFDENGRVTASGAASYPLHTPQPGWAEQDPNDWWCATAQVIRALLTESTAQPSQIAAVGVDGQSWSAVPLDAQGELLGNTPIWMDTRAGQICKDVQQSGLANDLFRVCRNRFAPSYTTPKILWYQQMGMHSRLRHVLQSNSWIVYKLTGALTQDLSQSYGLHCFDMQTGAYNEAAAKALGLELSLFPPILPCSAIAGHITEEAARLCGLLAGTPVVAGGLDAAAATLGAGVLHNGETQEQGGQAGGMSICTQSAQGDERLILSFHVVPGKWLLQGGSVGGGGVCRWIDETLGIGDFARLDAEAAAVPPGSDGVLFLPYMSGERSPIWNPNAKGVFFGLDYSKGRGHLARAALEGVAFSLRHNLEVAAGAGATVDCLHAVGGAANSRLWTQIKSDVVGQPIRAAQNDHAATLGAALIAGVGVGAYSNFEEAVRRTVLFTRQQEPNPEHKRIYDERYAQYLDLYTRLEPMMPSLL